MNVQDQLELNALFEELAPMGKKKVAVFLGRFSPPTAGHYAMINKVKAFIRKNKNLGLESAPAVVIIGGSKSDSDKKKNPLTPQERQLFMSASGKADGVTFFNAPNAFAAFSALREKGLEPIAIAAGTDRIDDYLRLLNQYFKNGEKPIKHFAIRLARESDAIETKAADKQKSMDEVLKNLKSSGDDADTGVISGSLARRAVELGYQPEFAKIVGLEHNPTLAKKMYAKIAKAMKD